MTVQRAQINRVNRQLAKLIRRPQAGIVLNEALADNALAAKFAGVGKENIAVTFKNPTWLDLPLGAFAVLDQGQKSKSARSKTRGGGGLGRLVARNDAPG
jgi:hypothetical protein